jgi:phosphoglycolate phosphatase
MSYLSVIFDLDGTLLDTLDDLAATCNEVLEYHNFPTHPVVAFKTFVGDGLQILMHKITPVGTSEMVLQQCCELFTKRYSQNWKRNSCPYDGINDMLSALKGHGVMLAVLSNKPHEFTKLFVDEFFPQGFFSIVCGQRHGFPKKPDPMVALNIAIQLGVLPRETLFVGDSGVDIMTGKAAEMGTVGVSWGFRSVEELTENNADIIVNSPLELEKYVLSCT